MNATAKTLIQAFAAVAVSVISAAAIPMMATAAPAKIEQLPRVVVTGKAVKAPVQMAVVHQLPRVVVSGHRSTVMALNTATAAAVRQA